jgi:RNA polymerase sigma factor (TIGR02999 family)
VTTSHEDLDALYQVVYEELRRLASIQRQRQAPSETLGTTAIVHEANVRLAEGGIARWNDRSHFLAVAARTMRYVLVDHARARSAAKRGGRQPAVSLDEGAIVADDRSDDVLAIEEALQRLEVHDARLGEVVQLRFFGGLSHEEIAEVVARSVPTVKRDWTRARAWLHRFITEGTAPA